MSALVAAVLRPLDRVRRHMLAAAGPIAIPLVRRRELRVAVSGVVIVGVALAATLLAPLWLLALSPLVSGVPHLLGDVRYLVVRPGYHRRLGLATAIALPLVGVALGLGAKVGLLAVAAAGVAARGSRPRRLALVVAATAMAALAWRSGRAVDLIVAHAHNFVAVALWWAWRPRAGRSHWLPLALFTVATMLLIAAPVERLVMLVGGFSSAPIGPGLSLDESVSWLAGDGLGVLGPRLVLAFAFAQAVHYGVWLRLIPDEDRARETTRGFGASWRALAKDLGPSLLYGATAVFVALAIWAMHDLAAARSGYFRLALFHGYLELAVAAVWVVEGRRAIALTPEVVIARAECARTAA